MAPSSPASPLFALRARNLDSVKNTLSSWDSCMAQSYCKWPVVAAIIVGSLIVLSIIFCCARCLCCGLECCFGCFSCCNACCPSPRRTGKQKSSGSSQPPQPWNTQYQPQGYMGYANQNSNNGPQYAQFDVPSSGQARINADSLPSMPSWQNATSRRVENPDYHEEEVEMEKLPSVGEVTPMNSQGTHPLSDEAHLPMLSTTAQEQDPSYRPIAGRTFSSEGSASPLAPNANNGRFGATTPDPNPYGYQDTSHSYAGQHGQNSPAQYGEQRHPEPSGYHSPAHAQTFPLTSSDYQHTYPPVAGTMPSQQYGSNMRTPSRPLDTGVSNMGPRYGQSSYAPHAISPARSYTQSPPQAYGYQSPSASSYQQPHASNREGWGYNDDAYSNTDFYNNTSPPAQTDETAHYPLPGPSRSTEPVPEVPVTMPTAEYHGGQAFTEQGVPTSLGIGRRRQPGS